jgi:amino acid adenylation domain-containing protein
MEYSTDLFERETIEQMLVHYQRLLQGLAPHPERQLWEVELLSPAEQRQQLAWNETSEEFAGAALVHELIEAQASRTPEAVALVYEQERLSYAELNRRANQVAHYLRRRGLGPESLVGILMERSVELVVSLLGVLKAGAAYVPLDPGYPAERLAYMVADAGAAVVLTQERLRAMLPAASVLCVDGDGAEIAGESGADEASGAGPANLVYVIYTSGSTGQPKGAMNTHEAVRNRLLWMQRAYGLTSADVVLQKTPFSFDVSVWEFFWPLLTGARLVLARPGGHRDSGYLAELIAGEQVTTLHFVPSMLRMFVEEEELAARCGSIRRVFSSGEALTQELARRLRGRLRQAELHNLYGPTEAAVDVSYHEWQESESGEAVVIGRPIANTQMYVLDERWRVVPVGVKGEIYLGGVGVGRGYWGRPELTAGRYVPDPFGVGGRLYRTGDVGRWRRDGEVEYVGRVDQQVKVRGHRIELGEVEAALESHTAVRECAVQAMQEESGGQRLTAYVAQHEERAVSVSELRRWLGERLPEYMVPSLMVLLAELPKLPNGKVDRRNLPAPDAVRPSLAAEYVPPQTEVQRTITNIWTQVLGIEQVGINDNFFDLGGHSLKMIEVLNKLKSALAVNVTLVDLFQYPTIALLAGWISKREEAPPVSTQVADRAETRRALMSKRTPARALSGQVMS